MKISTRRIIETALVECGAISPNEDVDFDEVDKGLLTLNRLIGRYNADSLFAFTKNRLKVEVEPGKSEYTIGLGDGLKATLVQELEWDRIKITFNKPHGYDTEDLLNIYDTLNFNGNQYRVYDVTDRTVTLLKDYVQIATLVNNTGSSIDVYVPDTSAFDVGETVRVSVPFLWGMSAPVLSISPTYISLDIPPTYVPPASGLPLSTALVTGDNDITSYADEKEGVVYKYTDVIPDIKKTRPQDLEVCSIIDNGTYFKLGKLWEDTWDHSLLNENISGPYLPHYFTYFSDYPLGKIKFDGPLDKAYDLELVYQITMDELELDTVVEMPSGYVDVLVMILADGLCGSYGIENPRIKMEASNAIAAIRKMNVTPSTVSRGRRSFDIQTGRYR